MRSKVSIIAISAGVIIAIAAFVAYANLSSAFSPMPISSNNGEYSGVKSHPENSTSRSHPLGIYLHRIIFNPGALNTGAKEFTIAQISEFPIVQDAIRNASQSQYGDFYSSDVNSTEAFRTIVAMGFENSSSIQGNATLSSIRLHYNNSFYDAYIMTPIILSVHNGAGFPSYYHIYNLTSVEAASYPALLDAINNEGSIGTYSTSIGPKEAKQLADHLQMLSIPVPGGFPGTISSNIQYHGKLYQVSLSSFGRL